MDIQLRNCCSPARFMYIIGCVQKGFFQHPTPEAQPSSHEGLALASQERLKNADFP
jgi:hypothetical protein